MKALTTIGRIEYIDLPNLRVLHVPAKVDTGADRSALWVSDLQETSGELKFRLFGPDSLYYTGDPVVTKQYSRTRVASSSGHRELRYVVKLRIRIKGRLVKASFTLTDRSHRTYPLLIGRRTLTGKFLVDVSAGTPLIEVEKQKRQRLKHDMSDLNEQKEDS